MKKRILLSAVLLSSCFSFAQSFQNRTSFWVKPDKAQNQDQTAYNRYMNDNYYSMTDDDPTDRRLNQNEALNQNVSQSLTTSIGEGASNFYVVFKSEDNVEKDLLDFTFTCYQHTVTTHNINYPDQNTVDLKRRTGAIVKYGFNFPNATGDKNYVTIAERPDDLTDVYEVIYVNDAFSDLDHQQVQTYLSLKYGISLINTENYTDINGNSLWNSGLNAEYNTYITGIGRSDYFGLHKTETINSVDKRLEIASNGFADNEYLFIGSTNENTNWIKEGTTEVLNTSWLVQTNTSSNLTTLRFNAEDNLHKNGAYELVVNPTASSFAMDENVTRYQGRIEGNQLVFDNVMFDTDGNGFDTFGISYSAKAKEVARPEIVNNSEVNAYPNPTNLDEKVTVAYRFDQPTNLNIHVFTVDGKFIAKKEVNNTTSYQYETSFNASGVYLIVSTYGGQVTTNRIIVK